MMFFEQRISDQIYHLQVSVNFYIPHNTRLYHISANFPSTVKYSTVTHISESSLIFSRRCVRPHLKQLPNTLHHLSAFLHYITLLYITLHYITPYTTDYSVATVS